MISVNIDAYRVIDFLDGTLDKNANVPLTEIGNLLVESVHENFRQEGRPEPWMPRQDNLSHPILRKSGDLYNSIYYQLIGNNEVMVEAGVEYSSYHDRGTSRLPARPFLLIQDEDEDRIENIIAQHLGI